MRIFWMALFFLGCAAVLPQGLRAADGQLGTSRADKGPLETINIAQPLAGEQQQAERPVPPSFPANGKSETETIPDTDVRNRAHLVQINWERTYGNTAADHLHSWTIMPDGGLLMAGKTNAVPTGPSNAWLVCTDAQGQLLWQKNFGNSDTDYARDLLSLTDGNFLMLGNQFSENNGRYNLWLVKLDPAGNILWQKNYGGERNEYARSIMATPDGNFLISGATESKGAGSFDVWLLKIDGEGNLLWDKTFGGTEYERAPILAMAEDGQFYLAGATQSKGAGQSDAWLLKFKANGKLRWEKTYGGAGYETINDFIFMPNGDFLLAGTTSTPGIQDSNGWFLRGSSDGKLLWEKNVGGAGKEAANALLALPDGGILAGGIKHAAGDPESDAWLLRMDAKGKFLWEVTMGQKPSSESISHLALLPDGQVLVLAEITVGGNSNLDANLMKIALSED
ncbi:MAG: hypothetical protein ABJO01_07155 [Parasphingorhabdus sp.]|uniref:hypothetical protein n=1 Tax=Parasphingorhabdus sp. TaxID=2709688 RepID=UPI0032996D9A